MDNREHKVIDKCQHRFQRFLKFFEEVDRQLPPELAGDLVRRLGVHRQLPGKRSVISDG